MGNLDGLLVLEEVELEEEDEDNEEDVGHENLKEETHVDDIEGR